MNVTDNWKTISFSWMIFPICSLLLINWKSCLELPFYKVWTLVKRCRCKEWRPLALFLPFLASLCRCFHSAGEETPAPSDPDLCVIFIGLEKKTIHRVIKIPMQTFIIHRTVLHFRKSVPNLLRQISNNKVTADLAECPTDVFGFSLGGSDGLEKRREIYTEAGTFHQLAQIKYKYSKWSWEG